MHGETNMAIHGERSKGLIMEITPTLIGNERLSRRVVVIGAAAAIAASLPLILRVDTLFPSLRWFLWGGLVILSLGLAGYAGLKDGGLLAGWTAVFLAGLWLYIVPPLVAYLQGAAFNDREYAVLRPSIVGLSPYEELITGLQIGPVVALLMAVIAGSAAFLLGTGFQRFLKASAGR